MRDKNVTNGKHAKTLNTLLEASPVWFCFGGARGALRLGDLLFLAHVLMVDVVRIWKQVGLNFTQPVPVNLGVD